MIRRAQTINAANPAENLAPDAELTILEPDTVLAANQGGAVAPLRIALLGYRSSPYSGGQGIYLRYLSRALVALGHKVTVISGPPYPELDDNVTLVTLPSLDLYQRGLESVTVREWLSDPLARREWWSKLSGGFIEPYTFAERARAYLLPRLQEFDIIHDNQTLADGILALQRAGANVVTTIHHPITRDLRHALAEEPRWQYRLLLRRWHSFLAMQGRVARQLKNIITVSALSKQDIIADFGVSPQVLTVLHNGVDTDVFRPLPAISRQPYQVMVTASADVPMKGLHIVLPALAALSARFPDVHLVVVGKKRAGGPTEQMLKTLALTERVTFVSDLSPQQIVEYYAHSAVAVVPSLYEGFGLPAVEAMACGIPLVSSDGGALKEVVADGGVLVPAGDITALTEALASVLADKALQDDLAARGLARVKQHFCWGACARRLSAYYAEVLADAHD